MIIKLILIKFILLLSLAASANNLLITKEISVDGVPTFFFKVSPDGRYFSYTLPSNPNRPAAGGENYILDSQTNRSMQIPGPWDPVFNVGSKYITIPKRVRGNSVYYEFYKVQDVLNKGLSASPIGYDKNLSGLYQSVGILQRTTHYIDYRVITEQPGNHSMRDFRFNLRNNTVKAISDKKKLCSNKEVKLPMISKNGREIGALDVDSQKTTIFKINNNGSCIKLFDLGGKYGKVNFSHDSKMLTFHKYNSNSPEVTDGYVAIPSQNTTSDIYIYSRKNKKITRLTSNIDSNALYPDFLKSGEIAYIDHPHDNSKNVRFITAKIDIISINNSRDFFKFLPKYRYSKKILHSFVSSYLISNKSIKVQTKRDYDKFISVVKKAGLLWRFVEKIAADGFLLGRSGLFLEAVRANDIDLISYLLAENNFKDYDREMVKVLERYLDNTISFSGDTEDIIIPFLIKSSFVEISSQKMAKKLLNKFSDNSSLLIEILSKLRRSKYDFESLGLIDFISDDYSTRIQSAVLRLSKMKKFKVSIEKFLNSQDILMLSVESRDLFAKKLLRGRIVSLDHDVLKRLLEIAWDQRENIIRKLTKLADSESFYTVLTYHSEKMDSFEYLKFIKENLNKTIECLERENDTNGIIIKLSAALHENDQVGSLILRDEYHALISLLTALGRIDYSKISLDNMLKIIFEHDNNSLRKQFESALLDSDYLFDKKVISRALSTNNYYGHLYRELFAKLELEKPGVIEQVFQESIESYSSRLNYRFLIDVILRNSSAKKVKRRRDVLRTLRRSNIKKERKDLFEDLKGLIKDEWS